MFELLLLAFLGSDSGQFWDQMSTQYDGSSPTIATLELPDRPVKINTQQAPRLLSEPFVAVYAQDPKSSKIFFDHQADRPQGIASLSKLMTYLVIRENHTLDEVVTVSPEAAQVVGASVDLYAYEKLTVATLLEAILIPSANDAAVALAIWDAGDEAAFVDKMNQKAQALGLETARFYNASGLDIERPKNDCDVSQAGCQIEVLGNMMSARDLMKLTRVLLRDPWFAATVQKDHFYGQSIDEAFFHEKESTNQLFGSFINSKGVKTGYTALAGQCFINLAVDEAGNEVLTVILGSIDRFTETKHLVDWIWQSFVWR